MVVGIALTVALEDVSSVQGGRTLFMSLEGVLLLFAFVATLIPFYHGALRHLDATYIVHGGKPLRRWALFVDFIILFVEGCVFLSMARLLGNPTLYAVWFSILLMVDVGWGVLVRYELQDRGAELAEWRWVQNNLGAIGVLLVVVLPLYLVLGVNAATGMAIAILVISLGRTIVDYRRSWDFYFPAD